MRKVLHLIFAIIGFVSVSLTSYGQYCSNAATYSADSNVDAVILNGSSVSINNPTTGVCDQYSDFTALPAADLFIGIGYDVTVTLGTCGGDYNKGGAVFIDWNSDGDFTDTGEKIGFFGLTNPTATFTTAFTVPATATVGVTRMRVVCQETSSASGIGPCDTYSYGGTEDYNVQVLVMQDNNLAAFSWDSPNLSSNNLTATTPIVCTVKNMGALAQSGYTVAYSIDNGSNFVTETVSASIASFATYQHTFAVTADMSAVGTFACIFQVGLTTDTDLSDNSLSVQVENSSSIVTYPYFEDFDTGAGDWAAGGSLSSWALGTPAATVINSAYSGTNSWTTNLTGNYNDNEYSWVESPFFNFATLANPIIEFKMWYDIETPNWDGVALQYSIDGGATWAHVGSEYGSLSLDPNGTNWYNDISIGGLFYTNGWSGNSGGWITGKYKLYDATTYGTNLANATSVKFRFLMGADAYTNMNGFAFDNVNIYQAPDNDAGVTSIYSLAQICEGSNDVYVTVENFGALTLSSVIIDWEVNGVLQTPVTYTTSIAVNGVDTVFLGTYSFVSGTVYTVTASTNTPSGVTDGNPFNDGTTLSNLETSFAGTYTIGTGGDYTTFGAAISEVETIGVCGPVVFNVLPGTYTEQVTIGEIDGTSASNTVTFKSSTGNTADVIVQYAGTGTTDNWVWRLNGCDYVTVQDMTIKSITASTYGRVVEILGGSDYNHIYNNILESIVTTSSNSAVLRSYTDGNDNYNVIEGNQIMNGYYGIYWYGSSASLENGNQFINNNITGYYYYGIYCYYSYATVATGNYIYQDPNGSTTNYPFTFGYTDGPYVCTKNVLHDDAGATFYGLRIYYCDATPLEPGLVANNIVTCENTTSTSYGMYLYYSNSCNVYHNSVNITSGTVSSRGAYVYGSASSGSYDFKNNNISVTCGGYTIYTVTAILPNSNSSNNNLYTNGGVFAYASGDISFTDWQTQFPGDVISVDPNYFSVTDLHTLLATLNDAGAPVDGVLDDIDGEMRNLLTPDIGADEFTPANDDGGVSALPGINAVCAGLTDVYATISNYGLATLNTATVNWEINGVAQTPVNLTAMGIASGATDDFLLGSYTFLNGVSYDIYASTTLPNGVVDMHPENDTLAVLGMMTSASGIYTIGATGDFLTVGDAVSFINNSGVCGPTVFNIQTGVYDEQVTIGNIAGTSAVNTITFQSLSGNASDVTVQYAASALADNWVWRLDGSSFITVQNLTIKSTTSSTYGRVVEIYSGATENNFFNNILEAPINNSSNTSVIYDYTGNNNNNVYDGNHLIGGYYCAYFRGSGTTSLQEGTVFTNNTLEDFYYYGIYSYYQDGIDITGNTVSNGSSSGSVYGIYAYYNDNDRRIVGNTINVSGTGTNYGIYMNYNDGTAANPGLVANNFIVQSNSTSTVYGMYVYYSNHQNIWYNTIHITGGSSTAGRGMYFNRASSGTYGNIDLANNNIVNSGGGYAIEIAVNAFTNPYITTHDYNNYYATGTNTFRVGSASIATLAEFQLYGLELNSVSVDPGFPTFDNPHLNNGDLNGAAMVIADITDDIDGDVRDLTNPDIGCDEFDLIMVDAGVTNVFGISAICPGITDVSAEIFNYGLIDQFSAIVNWSVNGVVQTPVTSNDTIIPTGTAVVYLGQYDFLSGVPYDISVWTTFPNGVNDPNTANNTYELLGMQTAIFGTYTIGVTGDFTTIQSAADFISMNGICGSVVFNIQPGVYAEQVTLNDVPGTDAVNTVTFQSATGINTDVVVEYAASGTGDNYVWAFNGADYVTVQNIKMQAIGTGNYGYVMIFQNSSNYNSVIGNILISKEVTSSYSLCIRSYNDSKDEHNLIQGNDLSNGYYGIYWYTSSSNQEEGNQFIDNSITNFYYYGLYNYYQYAVHAEGNYIQQSTTTASTTGYPTYFGYCDGPIRIIGNQLYDNAGATYYGLRVYYCDATALEPGLVANNMVGNENATGTVYGLYIYYSTNQKIYNNSVYIETGGSTYGAYLYGSGPYDFKNNSIVNMDDYYCLYGTSTILPGLTSDHNNLYSNGTVLCYFSAAYNTLADWQVMYPGDVVSTDGSYYGYNDLHSLSGALNAAGTPLSEVPFDFDGDVRNASTPDIGADEFNLPPDDVSVLQKMWHYGEVPIEGGADVVVGYVRNQGTNDQLNLPVTLTVTGANAWSTTFTIPLLASGDVDTILFEGFSPTMVGWNDLTITVPNDDDNTNNSFASYNQATQNAFAYADTSGSVGNGGQNNGRIYMTKYYMDGTHQVSGIQTYITGDLNNIGNTVYGVVLDAAGVILSNGNPVVLDTMHLDTWVTFDFPVSQMNVVSNNYFYAGFAQTVPVGSNYFPIGFQSEVPMRLDAYFYSLLDGTDFTEFTNDRRWMIKAITADPAPCDIACLGVIAPMGGCGLTTTEPVTIQIQNFGTDTVFGGVNASVQVDTNTVVTEVVAATILPGQVYDYTFTTGFDLFAPMDTFFMINSWVDLTCDTLLYNNTGSSFEVISMYVPANPVGYNDTINYGGQAYLTATSIDSLFWFEVDTLGLIIENGGSYTTPILFDTTTYYVAAITGAEEEGDITTTWAAGNGSAGNMFDITAYTDITIDGFDINGSSSALMEVWYRPGSYVGFNTSNAGWTLAGSYSVTSAGTGNPTSLPVGGIEIPAGQTYGIYVTYVSGSISYTNGNGSNQVYSNSDLMFEGGVGGGYFSATFNPRVWNGKIYYTAGTPGCASEFIPVTAVVENIPPYDAALVGATSPVSGIELGNETVCVDIENWGTDAFSGFMITYAIPSTSSSVTEIVSQQLLPGDSYNYCFVTPADLTAFGCYDIIVYVQLTADGYNLNDTINFTVCNDPLTYCTSSATSTGYEEIIKVEVGSMSNVSGPASGVMYSDFTSVTPPVLSPGLPVDVVIQTDFAPGYSTQYGCWVELYIDFNHNAIFEEPGEVFVSQATQSSATINASFTVPFTAQAGFHGMRVVFREGGNASTTQPCGTYTWGETEDYIVQVLEPIPVDAGVTAILQPTTTGVLTQNGIAPVEVIAFNLGSDTIFAMDVVYTIDGMGPFVFPYTGALAYLESDTIQFADIVIPGGYFDLCAYTILAGDTQPANDTTCFTYYGVPQWDIALSSMEAPIPGCNYGMEDVSIVIENIGDTIFGGITASFFTAGMSAPVNELITDTLYPGDMYTYNFTNQIDLFVTVDTEFDIMTYVNYVDDPVGQNDTINSLVLSGVSPAAPVVLDQTIWSGEFTTLEVINPDTGLIYNWYAADGITNLAVDSVFTTPVLFDTTTYYITAASGGAGSLGISEVDLGGPDFIEIQNMTGGQIDATGWVVAVSDSYTDINSVNAIYWNLGVFAPDEVQFRTDQSGLNYWGNNLFWNPGAPPSFRGWAMIVDDQGTIIDYVAWGWTQAEILSFITQINGFAVDMTTAWSGDGLMSYPSNVLERIEYDNNVVDDWVNVSANTMGVASSNLVITGGGGAGCETPLIPVTVYTQYAAYDAALVNVVSPYTGAYLGILPVTVDIYNNGLNELVNFPVSYQFNNGAVMTDTVAGPLAVGTTMTYTFSTTVDMATLPFAGSIVNYDFCTWTSVANDGYTANDSICMVVSNMDGDGATCATAFPYLYINEPMVYGQTLLPYDNEWWRFDLPIDANNVVVSLCGSSFNTILNIYSNCNSGTPIATNDNLCGTASQVTFSYLSAGTYFCKILGSGIDYGQYQLEITGEYVPVIQVDPTITNIDCNGNSGGSITTIVTPLVGSTLPFTYLWSNGETTQSIFNLTAGQYCLTVTDANGLFQIDCFDVVEPDVLVASVVGTDVSGMGIGDGSAVLNVSGGSLNYSCQWGTGTFVTGSADPFVDTQTGLYAGVYNVLVSDANGCTTVASDSVNSLAPWTVAPTAISHLIHIPQNAVITLDGLGLSPGSFVGVFYTSGSGSTATQECGGWAYWSGMETEFWAYGAEAPLDNGFGPGETFAWKVYDAGLNVEFGGSATYNTSYPNAGNFAILGESGITDLAAFSIITQTIVLNNTWNIFSTYINPVYPNIADILGVLATGDIEIVKNGLGQIYWPTWSINFINNIVIGEGYQVKINVPTVTFGVTGLLIDPATTPLNYGAGWSLIGYLRTTPAPIVTLFAPIVSCIEIVKNDLGSIYWPTWNIDFIGNMIPGEGYQLKMNCAATYTFPPAAFAKANIFHNEAVNYDEIDITGNNMSLGILNTAWSVKPESGDEIGVFNSEGLLVGSAVYENDFTALTIWGPEELDKAKDVQGDFFTIKLWRDATGEESEIVVEAWQEGNGQFETNSIQIIEKLRVDGIGADQYALFQNIPNPFKSTTEISFNVPESCNVTLTVFNALGEKVEVLTDRMYEAGTHTVEFEAGNLPSGTYFYKIITDEFVATKPMNLNR